MSKAFRKAAQATVLVFAALNAVSYFMFSEHGSLLGYQRGVDRLGFPWVVWQDGAELSSGIAVIYMGADGYFDYGALAIDASVALIASLIVGVLATLWTRSSADGQPGRPATLAPSSRAGPPQFSLRALMIVTTVVAVALAGERVATERSRAFSLAAIFMFGPSALICCAYTVRHRRRAEQFIAIWFALTMLVAGAIAAGVRTDLADFTRVLLGLFVYWVPQCVGMLGAHAAWRMFFASRDRA